MEVIKAEFTEIPASADLVQLNQLFREKHSASPQHVLATLRVQAALGKDDRAKLAKDVVALLQLDSVQLEDARDAQEVLQGWHSNELEGFKKAAAVKWPESSIFA